MKTKDEIVRDWLPRYTGRPLEAFGSYILLSNFGLYVELFAEKFGVEVMGRDKPMLSATAQDITIVNFGMGSPMAATAMDLLSAVGPKAVLFLGKCGGFKKTRVGDYILPIAAIRGEGTSNDYLPAEIPALPSFRLQRAVSATIVKHRCDDWTGTIYTTNRRVWEHDQTFKDYLTRVRVLGIDEATPWATREVADYDRSSLIGARPCPTLIRRRWRSIEACGQPTSATTSSSSTTTAPNLRSSTLAASTRTRRYSPMTS